VAATTPPESPARPAEPKHPPRVGIITGDNRRLSVDVEVVHTLPERERGLMFRKTLAPETGMLFIFDDDQDHMFWMKNTLIPLDMIFISQEGVVEGIVRDAAPETETPRSVNHASRYVLEVNAGWAALKGVETGARVDVSEALPR
jgi:hypothetical protein